MRVLWVAFACAPGRGSEPGLGYRLTVEVARHVRSLVVLTASHNRGAIEKGAALPANVTVEYVPAPDLRGEFGHRLSYLVWLARALWRAGAPRPRALRSRPPRDVRDELDPAAAGPAGRPVHLERGEHSGNSDVVPFRAASPRIPRGGDA